MDSLQLSIKSKQLFMKKRNGIFQRKKKCHFCTSMEAVYICPQCDSSYCSSECFKCVQHIKCSEHFFKKCVFDYLKNTRIDKDEQLRFLEMLKRNSSATNQDVIDYCDLLDSSNIDELDHFNLDLVKNQQIQIFIEKIINQLDSNCDDQNMNDIWTQISDEDRINFMNLVKKNSKLFDDIINRWIPWWRKNVWQQPILKEETNHNDDDYDVEENVHPFPILFSQLEPISKLTSRSSSPTIGNHIISVIFAYCHLCRLYNGEISSNEPLIATSELENIDKQKSKWTIDIIEELYRICPFLNSQMKDSIILECPSQAIELSLGCLLSSDELITTQIKWLAIELLEDTRIIFEFQKDCINGRIFTICDQQMTKEKHTLYCPKAILLVLSDLIHIIENVQTNNCNSKTFKRSTELARRKLIFYLCWTVENSDVIDQMNLSTLQTIDLEVGKLKNEILLIEKEKQELKMI